MPGQVDRRRFLGIDLHDPVRWPVRKAAWSRRVPRTVRRFNAAAWIRSRIGGNAIRPAGAGQIGSLSCPLSRRVMTQEEGRPDEPIAIAPISVPRQRAGTMAARAQDAAMTFFISSLGSGDGTSRRSRRGRRLCQRPRRGGGSTSKTGGLPLDVGGQRQGPHWCRPTALMPKGVLIAAGLADLQARRRT